jgi:hypothetical protein
MLKKLTGYSLLSLLSFCFFTALLHTVANAQTSLNQNSLPSEIKPTIEPTPTIFVYVAPTGIRQTSPIPSSPIPTEVKALSLTPTHTPTPQPTFTPTPTNIPTQPTITSSPTVIFTPTPTFVPQAVVSTVTDIESLFTKYSDDYHVDKELLKRIARCESGFNSNAHNGNYVGMFQFGEQTWISWRGRMGLDGNPDLRLSAEESIRTAAYMVSQGRQGSWPNCQ